MKKKLKLTRKQVLHIAKLANLKLTKKEVEKFRGQLADILGYIRVLNELDTKKVKPTSQVTGLKNVFRKDRAEKEQGLSQKEALSGTESQHKGYFRTESIFS